jgi:hypothetical protein
MCFSKNKPTLPDAHVEQQKGWKKGKPDPIEQELNMERTMVSRKKTCQIKNPQIGYDSIK